MIVRRFNLLFIAMLLLAFADGRAQFGGRPGDVVIYAVVSKGTGDFQVVSPTTTNDSQTLAGFKVTDVSTVPISSSAPFGLKRQVLFEAADELFQVGTDDEASVGAHRSFLVPVKVFTFQGLLRTTPFALGTAGNYIIFPKGLDVEGDLALDTVKFLFWSPKNWPFIEPTSARGPVGPPNVTGFEYLVTTPGLVRLPAFLPWISLRNIIPNVGWKDGVDLKLLDADPAAGNVTALIRLRPGRQTPLFRISGSTHLYVLQGSLDVTPAGADTVTLKQNHYAFVPRNLAIKLSNPKKYDGPSAR